jgi:hypothetical protein
MGYPLNKQWQNLEPSSIPTSPLSIHWEPIQPIKPFHEPATNPTSNKPNSILALSPTPHSHKETPTCKTKSIFFHLFTIKPLRSTLSMAQPSKEINLKKDHTTKSKKT